MDGFLPIETDALVNRYHDMIDTATWGAEEQRYKRLLVLAIIAAVQRMDELINLMELDGSDGE